MPAILLTGHCPNRGSRNSSPDRFLWHWLHCRGTTSTPVRMSFFAPDYPIGSSKCSLKLALMPYSTLADLGFWIGFREGIRIGIRHELLTYSGCLGLEASNGRNQESNLRRFTSSESCCREFESLTATRFGDLVFVAGHEPGLHGYLPKLPNFEPYAPAHCRCCETRRNFLRGWRYNYSEISVQFSRRR